MPYFLAHLRQRLGSHSVVDRYFSPPSGAMATITPLSISSAFFRAVWNMAPELGPTNMPSCSASSLVDFVYACFFPYGGDVLGFKVF